MNPGRLVGALRARPRPGAGRGRIRRAGVTSRLLFMAVLPLVVLGAVAVPLVVAQNRAAGLASDAVDRARAAAVRLTALDEVVKESNLSVAVTMMRLYGITNIGPLAFTKAEADLAVDQSDTDRALAAFPAAPKADLAGHLNDVRQSVREGAATLDSVTADYSSIVADLSVETATVIQSYGNAALRTNGGFTVGRTIQTLNACFQLVRGRADQVVTATREIFETGPAARALAVQLSHYTQTVIESEQGLRSSGIPAVESALSRYLGSDGVANYDKFMSAAELAQPVPLVNGNYTPSAGTIPLQVLISAYAAIPSQSQLLASVVATTDDGIRTRLLSLLAHERHQLELWVGLVLAAAAVVIAAAIATARSIGRPLSRLHGAARSVVGGDLAVAELPAGGPRETSMVADAFNALMANLRLLEAKTQALASCDFENEVLSVPLPGLLGASLQDSVHLLAGSIQDRDELQQRLAFDATHDTLTGLLNRAGALTSIEQAITRSARRIDTTAVLYIDLDNFKRVNDVHGHQAGDDVLREVGARLTGASRHGEIVARLGGDEFVVVAERVEDVEEACAVAERLNEILSQPIHIGSVTLNGGASIGLAVSRGNEKSASDLLAEADMALYEAKRHGGGQVKVYDQGLQERLALADEVERELRLELERGGDNLVLHFQPVVGVDMEVHGFEALLRWQREGHGMVPPDQFIPVAEASDLIIEVDRWVLAKAVSELAAWADDPSLVGIGVAINVSGRHVLSGNLPGFVEGLLGLHQVDPGLITIELTETVLMNDLTVAANELKRLRDIGVRLAIDDFGTGYTSLAHLHYLPLDFVKIDRTFISHIQTSGDASLVRMITDLAKQLGLTTVSEGVETPEQLDILKELGSDRIQGYLVARPMPADQVRGWAGDHLSRAGRPLAERTSG